VIVIAADVLPTLASYTPEQFGDWARPHLRAMSLLAARLSSDAERDDVVQEALSRAWAKRAQFDAHRGTPAAWLLAITADQARRARRRKRRPIVGLVPGTVRAVDEGLDLEVALGRLTDRQRLAIDCFYFVGLSISEAAAVMRCSEGTVKSTLSDARQRLRTLLEIRDGPA
jgi:DNA-directed RNA polymerase specialized sigma24 family protein